MNLLEMASKIDAIAAMLKFDNDEAQMTNELRNLGWLNDGPSKEREEIIAKCRAAVPAHQVIDIDVGPPHRGMEHVVTCETCGYVYRYDSSD